ncbi:MAG: hypothetical protein ACREXT_12300 [Gammaproteobacteria bacterium]
MLGVAVMLASPAFANDIDEHDHRADVATAQTPESQAVMADMARDPHINHSGPHMGVHMQFTPKREASVADRARAAVLVKELQASLEKYKDVNAAKADGYKIFAPEHEQKMYHFTRWWYALKAAFTFNPKHPTSLLYDKTPDGQFKLIGAMYTAPKRASQEQLDKRVPLSIARWHRHVNMCFPPKGTDPKTVDWTTFGNGSITTEQQCDAAGGRFYPQLFGWMVHVYPWEQDAKLVWPN